MKFIFFMLIIIIILLTYLLLKKKEHFPVSEDIFANVADVAALPICEMSQDERDYSIAVGGSRGNPDVFSCQEYQDSFNVCTNENALNYNLIIENCPVTCAIARGDCEGSNNSGSEGSNNSNSEGSNNSGSSNITAIDDNTDSQCSSVCLRFPDNNNIGNCCDCLQEHNDQKFCSNNGNKYIAHHLTENGVFCCPSRQ